ncbi:DUF4397 domain-containing protein [Pedobacter duraquae]|uniref:Uncharacterized protein DUF4397 n=1 Tax=Pedobacter duraquae TaxID=425511 RepID=A0A4R6IKE2_9SPHI|nr:DUF4397 domain-containing protein [Pedobacter duraquae]TDO22425.1 uncharacterized protein DUF4397 [Pedobacter duraquae]
MKITSNSKLRNLLLASSLALVAILPACKLDEVPNPDVSALTIINASPNSTAIDFYLDNERVNAADGSFLFPLRIPYQRILAGNHQATVRAAGSATSLLQSNLTFPTNQYGSLFIIGKADALAYLQIKDELTYPTAGKTKVRFINLIPDATTLTMEIVGDATTFSNKAYKEFSNFENVTSGVKTILLKDAATNTTVATLTDYDLKADKVYTIWAKGLITTAVTTQKAGLQVINHDL